MTTIQGTVRQGSYWCGDDMDDGWCGWFLLDAIDADQVVAVKMRDPELFAQVGKGRVTLEGEWTKETVVAKSVDGEKVASWTYDRFVATGLGKS